MSAAYYIIGLCSGLGFGFVLGVLYYKHQILRRKNPRVIEAVKSWIAAAESETTW